MMSQTKSAGGVNILNVSSGFRIREKCSRGLMAAIIGLWAIAGTSAMPLMSAAECRDMAMNSGCDRMHQAATPHRTSKQGSSANQECCKKKPLGKPAPVKAGMPGCPMHEGLMPRTCGMAELSCCAVMGREPTARRAAKPENTKGNETPSLLLAKIRSGPSAASFDRRDRHLSDGLRFEKPVFDLKTDLRV